MKKLLDVKPIVLYAIFIVIDILCIGMGMGVPIFCILFGLVAGWVIGKYISAKPAKLPQVLRTILYIDALTAAITLVGMAIIWLPFGSYLFDPAKDLANTGIPMILFTPKASFIGWIVLMVIISPVLQLLTSLFGSYLALISWEPRIPGDQKAV